MPSKYVSIFKFIWLYKKKEFYIPLGFMLMSSKNEDLYSEIFEQLKRIILKIQKLKNSPRLK